VKVVVADTGPLHYLALIGEIDVLPRLFGTVIVPAEVRTELDQPMTPPSVRVLATTPPPWLDVRPTPLTDDGDATLRALDAGERAAIVLAASIGADLILMDDRPGVAAARAKGFAVTGTLGLLERAFRHGWIDLAGAVAALRATNFHIRQELLDILLAEARGKA
jgi:predicted nucleic acid-binding protein